MKYPFVVFWFMLRLVKCKKNNIQQVYKESRSFIHCWWRCKLVQIYKPYQKNLGDKMKVGIWNFSDYRKDIEFFPYIRKHPQSKHILSEIKTRNSHRFMKFFQFQHFWNKTINSHKRMKNFKISELHGF